jgi:hypothetical protein
MAELAISRASTLDLAERAQGILKRWHSFKGRIEQSSARLQHTAVSLIAGFAFGMARGHTEASGNVLPSVFQLNPALLYGGVGWAIGEYMGGRSGEILNAASTTLLSVWSYELGMEQGQTSGRAAGQLGAGGHAGR